MTSRIVEYTEKLTRGDKPGRITAHIEVTLSHEASDAPPLNTCRYAVLELSVKSRAEHACVIYDRWLNRIVDGVYYVPPADVLHIAANMNTHPNDPYEWRSPNGAALGLRYPSPDDLRDDE